MSKICIIGASNLKHISLISLYTKYFDENKISYDIIYMDRYGIDENVSAENKYCFHAEIKSKTQKIKAFLGFRRYVKKIIKKNNYSLLITWQTTSAYLFCDLLLTRYKRKFVINVRDYVAENNSVIRFILKKLVKKASMVAISSDGFRDFLPVGDYTLVNSINDDILSGYQPVKKGKIELPYHVGFAGNCRYFRESYKLIQALANDERFELWFCGTNSEQLKKYAEENEIRNVKTRPAFSPSETIAIFNGFDIVNSAFGNDAWDNKTLMPIRLYTALCLHLPMLVSSKTQLAKEVHRGNIGFVIEDYSTLGDDLYNYLSSINDDELANNCDCYIATSREENIIFYKKLSDVIKDLR